MSDVEFKHDADGNYRVIGSLRFDNVRDMLKQSAAVFASQDELAFDLSGVTNADSAGLALLIEWYRLAERNQRRLRFIGASQQLRALAKISDLDTLLPFA
jgi:phospholipid transport system transporter-binding protein